MFIIADYTLDFYPQFLKVSSRELPPQCPCCGGDLEYHDSKKRIIRYESGERNDLLIRRFKCQGNCGSLHNELPDCVVPYKHYSTEIISGVLDGIVTQNDLDTEDRPCAETMKRWIHWFRMNLEYIEGILRQILSRLSDYNKAIIFSKDSAYKTIHSKYHDWLEKVIRMIYNSGGMLTPVWF